MSADHPRHIQVQQATATLDANAEPQTLPVNMYEAGDALVLVAPVPAVQPDDVVITVLPEQVAIRAGLRSAAPKDYLLHEWRYGNFERVVDIPPGFGVRTEATLANGQLAVRLLRGDAVASYTVSPTGP